MWLFLLIVLIGVPVLSLCTVFSNLLISASKATNSGSTASTPRGVPAVPAVLGTDNKTLYITDWSKDLNHWTAGSEWKWIQSNVVGSDGGQGQQGYNENPHDYFLVAPYNPDNADYEIDAQIQYLHSASNNAGDFGIIVRSDQDGNGYFCGFDASESHYDIELMHNNGYGSLSTTSLTQNYATIGDNPITMDNQYHTYSTRVQKNVITLLVDGKQMAQVTDNTYLSAGLVGLRAYSTVVDVHSLRVEKVS